MKSNTSSTEWEKRIWACVDSIENKREVVAPPRTVCYYHEIKDLLTQNRNELLKDVISIIDNQLTPHYFESDHSPTEKILQDTKIKHRDKIIATLWKKYSV